MKNLKNLFHALSVVAVSAFAFSGADASAKPLSELIEAGEKVKGVNLLCRSLDSGVDAHDLFRFSGVVFIDLAKNQGRGGEIIVETSATLDMEIPAVGGDRDRGQVPVSGSYLVGESTRWSNEPLKIDVLELSNPFFALELAPIVGGEEIRGGMFLKEEQLTLDLSCRFAAIK